MVPEDNAPVEPFPFVDATKADDYELPAGRIDTAETLPVIDGVQQN